MKKNFFLTFLVALLLITNMMSISACTSTVTDNGFINTDDTYEDISYWETDNLDLVTNISIKYVDNDSSFNPTITDLRLSNDQSKKVTVLKKAIHNYFLENYGIDFSEKLKLQKIDFFKNYDIEDNMLLGYVDSDDANKLHLSELLNTQEYMYQFEYTYVHESLHQLGFYDNSGQLHYLIEGIVDAYTDLILVSNGFESNPTDIYFEARQLGYQMISSDRELATVFVNNLSLQKHINDSLVYYKQNFLKKNNLAQYLEQLIDVFVVINAGMAYSDDLSFFAFDAQMIVQRFCQSQNCDEAQIEYIRKHYIVKNFENLKVINDLEDSIDNNN